MALIAGACNPPKREANVSSTQKPRALDDRRIDTLVAFLKALTDRRHEHVLENE
jgi:hypothetical protein